MKSFHLSLSKGAKEWWMNEGNGNISTWEELVKKFFKKFYPLSCAINYDKMCDDDEEEIYKVEGLLNDEVSSDEDWEEQEYENPPKYSFPKPYFEMDKNNHNENNSNTYKSSGMDLSGAPQSENINNEQPNEGVCRVDKFKVIKYTIGDNEEFLAICTRESGSWERTVNGVSIDIFNINAIADLGANVNIMSESILKELSLADLKIANIIVETADKTRCVSQGIIENVLVKIDKFSFTSDFVIIDTKGLNNKTIILGRPFLANIRAEINISTREVSLGIKEDRVKIKMNEQECNLTTTVSEHLNEQPTLQDELSHGADSKTYWCEPVRQEHEKGYTLWASCDPYHEICDGGGIPDKKLNHYWKSTNNDDRISLEWEGLSYTNWVRARYGNVNDITKEMIPQIFWDNKLRGQIREKTLTEEHEDHEKCGETKTRAIIGAMINKLPEEWFSGVSRDMDDLEGIIDYLEPTLYDGFINHNDEAYKRRRNKLLEIPYTEPPPIIKEEAEITKYNLGAGEWKEDICIKWSSCNPHFDECDGGDDLRENKEYWESSNDDMRTNLEWENLSFDNWVKVAFGKQLRRNEFSLRRNHGSSIPINRGLIQAIPTSLPPQPIGEATKASNLPSKNSN
ncbi:RNA-directed DNA polymerase, eukaryota, reverse transcriptase zinc-binding domain protein [Tanacetum coccineum]|uniref:RNA-directed DNA polymerase, eukaryota, reverse transcriptase zinc-binding domain protein n=1 Tax=Tanacetum coccineum TaxID=301880 RepID=A0ABQ4XH26_9ASTR